MFFRQGIDCVNDAVHLAGQDFASISQHHGVREIVDVLGCARKVYEFFDRIQFCVAVGAFFDQILDRFDIVVGRAFNFFDTSGIVERKIGDQIVAVDPRYFRPAEVETLLGDPTKAKAKLGWVPEITVEEMCAEMVAADLEEAQRHALLKAHGFDLPIAAEV